MPLSFPNWSSSMPSTLLLLVTSNHHRLLILLYFVLFPTSLMGHPSSLALPSRIGHLTTATSTSGIACMSHPWHGHPYSTLSMIPPSLVNSDISAPKLLLRLDTPNNISTDLVVFLSFLILSDQLMTATLPLCFSFPFTLCRMHSSPLSSPCSAWLCLTLFLPFCHCRAVASCITSFPFHGHA